MRLQVVSLVAFAATLAAAAEEDTACYFKCARQAPAAKNDSIPGLSESDIQCVSQEDNAKIFRCVCESKMLQGAIHYCMFTTCNEQLQFKDNIANQGCDISDAKLNSLLNGDGTNSAVGSAIAGAAWLAAGATTLGAILLA